MVVWIGPHSLYATTVTFVDGIWFADEQFYAGTPTRVYVALRNTSSTNITGLVRLYDNDTLLDERPVSALPGRLLETWLDWTPSEPGEYDLSISLYELRIHHPESIERIPGTSATLSHTTVSVAPAQQPETSLNASHQDTETKTAPRATTTPGLEEYITHERTREYLETMTAWLNQFDNQVSQYQQKRAEQNAAQLAATSTTDRQYDELGRPLGTTTIGEFITRPARAFLQRNWDHAVDYTLTGIRWLLAHPTLVQLLVILLIVLLLHRLLRRLWRS